MQGFSFWVVPHICSCSKPGVQLVREVSNGASLLYGKLRQQFVEKLLLDGEDKYRVMHGPGTEICYRAFDTAATLVVPILHKGES
ncbi:hypothetical protein NDU88_000100 [Pleurodeles waltl]|uniref:Uncharacterized protein n=1 Tax=Pleurodeles waltl TaxID=8319 RepID=A0AAV7UQW0_PLEWA|nr:hypothetical protein NDU88_000100 [Pleurodeles waltl]